MKKIKNIKKVFYAVFFCASFFASALPSAAAGENGPVILYEADFNNFSDWQINAGETDSKVEDGRLWLAPFNEFTAISKPITLNLDDDPYMCVSVGFDDDDHMWSASVSFPDGEYVHMVVNDAYGGDFELSIVEALENAGRDATGPVTCNLLLWAVAKGPGMDGHVIFNSFKLTSGPLTPPAAPAPAQEKTDPATETGTETETETEAETGAGGDESGFPPAAIAAIAIGAAAVACAAVLVVIKKGKIGNRAPRG